MKYLLLILAIVLVVAGAYVYMKKYKMLPFHKPLSNPYCASTPGVSGTGKMCVGTENGVAYCYGNANGCAWGGNCSTDSDCSQFAVGATNNNQKYTDNMKCSAGFTNPQYWGIASCMAGQ